MQAVIKYPPVGASQSSISPAQNIPGMDRSIKCSSSNSNLTPPALLIASSNGRVASYWDRQILDEVGEAFHIGVVLL